MTILVTGGAGLIGSNFVLDWCPQSDEPVNNLDKLTYTGNVENLASLQVANVQSGTYREWVAKQYEGAAV